MFSGSARMQATTQVGNVSLGSEDQLALRLRLQEDWRDILGNVDGGIVAAHQALIAAEHLSSSEGQVEAASSLGTLPAVLSAARVARRTWEAEQLRLTKLAAEASARGVEERKKAAAWRGESWFEGSPAAPAQPAVLGPMCWLGLGPPPTMTPAGCYVHGSVGSGKSTLMDLFCLVGLPGWRVRRQHFHEFSLWLHENLHALGQGSSSSTSYGTSGGPRKHVLSRLVEQLATEIDALCLDEFAITNVADAAIFGEVLRLLAARHILVVCTTNRPPEDLYKDGLHRERYVPALVDHIRGRCTVVPIDGVDFRSQMLRAEAARLRESSSEAAGAAEEQPSASVQQVFFEGGCAEEAMHSALGAEVEGLAPGSIKVSWGRSMAVSRAWHQVRSRSPGDAPWRCRGSSAAPPASTLTTSVGRPSLPRTSCT